MPADPYDHSVTEALRAWRVQHSAGIAVGPSLETCAAICTFNSGKNCFLAAARHANGGGSIEQLLSALEPLLSQGERSTIAAGWNGGRADAVLDAVIAQRELWEIAMRKIRSHMMLPLLTLLMASFIAPLLELVRCGNVLMYFYSALFPIIIAAVVWKISAYLLQRRARVATTGGPGALPKSADAFDRLLLSLPVVSQIEKNRNVSEIFMLLSNLISAGVTLSSALDMAAHCASNGVYRTELYRCSKMVQNGNALSKMLVLGNLWRVEQIAAVEVGEISGSLDDALARIGNFARDRYVASIDRFAEWLPRFMYGIIAMFMLISIFHGVSVIFGIYQSVMR